MKAIKKWITIEWIGLLLLTVTTVSVIYTGYQIRHDVLEASGDVINRAIDSNVYTYGKQTKQFFVTRMGELENLANYVNQVRLSDPEQMNQILAGHSDQFDNLGIIDSAGNTIAGDYFDIPNYFRSEYFDGLADGQSIVAPNTYQNDTGDPIFYFFAAAGQSDQKIILVGSVPTVRIINSFDTVDFVGEGCLCIINQDGDYLVGERICNSGSDSLRHGFLRHGYIGAVARFLSDFGTYGTPLAGDDIRGVGGIKLVPLSVLGAVGAETIRYLRLGYSL